MQQHKPDVNQKAKAGRVQMGKGGQQAAADFLRRLGCVVLKENFRTGIGEIDLIVQDGAYIAFVEVKTRNSLNYGRPCEAVTQRKQWCIKRTAEQYISIKGLVNQDFRFDVVEVLNTPQGTEINHIKDAFW